MNRRAFTIMELVVVVTLVSILFIAGFRAISDTADRERYQKTVAELDLVRQAVVGDERIVEFGKRVDFGYFGQYAAWPATMAALYPFFEGSSTAVASTDAWGHNYVITATASSWQVSSYGADNAAGGTGFGTDIALTIKRAGWENNSVIILVCDARGTLLLPAVDESSQLTKGHIARVTLNEHAGSGSYTAHVWSSENTGLLVQEGGFYSGATIAAGRCQVIVEIADGTGDASGIYMGTYDWTKQLTTQDEDGAVTRDLVVYPLGDSWEPNVMSVRLSGAVSSGLNEV